MVYWQNTEGGVSVSYTHLDVYKRQILENAASYVRPGGTLVYSTCTVLPEENEDVTGDFLDQHPASGLTQSSAQVVPFHGACLLYTSRCV